LGEGFRRFETGTSRLGRSCNYTGFAGVVNQVLGMVFNPGGGLVEGLPDQDDDEEAEGEGEEGHPAAFAFC
jgi:hypothetical protein